MTTPTPEQRLAFAHGITLLLLKHVKMTRRDKAYVESVRDAQTPEQMLECWRNAWAYATVSASAFASASASAFASSSASAYACERACERAIEAGVPEAQVKALRALAIGLEN